MTQEQYRKEYHRWKAKAEEIREQINKFNSEGKDGKAMFGKSLENAESQARNCYELATDRGF